MGFFKPKTEKIQILAPEIMKRPIAEYFDFEEFAGRSDECTYGTRGTTTDQKLKRNAFCNGPTGSSCPSHHPYQYQ